MSPARNLVVLIAIALVFAKPLAIIAQVASPSATVTVRTIGPEGPLGGVQVTASGVGAVTSEAGEALLRLPVGAHVLTGERIGFASARLDLVLESARDTSVVLELEPEAVETEGLVVTSGRTERRIEDEPLRIEAVSREEVEEKLLMTPGDIAMLLNETAGLRCPA